MRAQALARRAHAAFDHRVGERRQSFLAHTRTSGGAGRPRTRPRGGPGRSGRGVRGLAPMEERVQMKKYKLLALAATLALAGCATMDGPAPVESRDGTSAKAAPGGPPFIPQGELSAIKPSELTSSSSVASLEPPQDLWSRIRRGFAMPTLENDLV